MDGWEAGKFLRIIEGTGWATEWQAGSASGVQWQRHRAILDGSTAEHTVVPLSPCRTGEINQLPPFPLLTVFPNLECVNGEKCNLLALSECVGQL